MICNPCIISSDNSIIYKNRNSIKADRPIIFSKKHALNLNKTPDKNKVKINIGDNYDIKKITNYNLIWKKIEIKYNYKYDNNNFIFNNFKPNKNIVLVETNKNEKKLILNNKKNNIIIKPNINKLKKIKTKSKSKIKKIRIKNKSSENSNSSLSIKKTYTEKKIKIISFKQKIINKYNIKETKDNEPLLKLERKLIMEKPFK